MLRFIWPLVILLLILHQDNWNWDDSSLVFGFIPIGLFYHLCLSLAAAATWLLVVLFCWPKELDDDNTTASEGASK